MMTQQLSHETLCKRRFCFEGRFRSFVYVMMLMSVPLLMESRRGGAEK